MPGYVQPDGSILWKISTLDVAWCTPQEYLNTYQQDARGAYIIDRDGRPPFRMSWDRVLMLIAGLPTSEPFSPPEDKKYFAATLQIDQAMSCCGIREVRQYFTGLTPPSHDRFAGPDPEGYVTDINGLWGGAAWQNLRDVVYGSSELDAWYNWMQAKIDTLIGSYSLKRIDRGELPSQARIFNCLSDRDGTERQGALKKVLLEYLDAEKSHIQYRNVNTGNIIDTIVVVFNKDTKMKEKTW